MTALVCVVGRLMTARRAGEGVTAVVVGHCRASTRRDAPGPESPCGPPPDYEPGFFSARTLHRWLAHAGRLDASRGGEPLGTGTKERARGRSDADIRQ